MLESCMANHRIGETAAHYNTPLSTSFINQEGSSAFDFGELEEAIVLQGVSNKFRNNDEAPKPSLFAGGGGGRPATLDMFPSWPIRSLQTPRGSCSKSGGGGGGESTDSGSGVNTTISSKAEGQESPSSDQLFIDMAPPPTTTTSSQLNQPKDHNNNIIKRKGAGSTSNKPLDAKTLRRLAQNREAARKSRLRKKAYVQQLETSRIKLTQLEQELQRARSQGLFLGGCGSNAGGNNITSGAAIFDMEYARWLEDDIRHMSELRSGLNAHLPDNDLRIIVDGYISHYDEIFRLKTAAAKSDIFHLITGMWTSATERCFLWMGGFRPSELIKMLITQLDPLTEQQVMGICSLQHSSQQAEEALTQGLEQLQHSLVETIASAPLLDGMQQMVIALSKLANLEGFVRQADNLRQQTLHQLRRILTVRQAARCFLVIGEYYGRLRALSSLWASRPRESLMSEENSCQTTTELQMVQSTQQNHPHFASF